MQTRARVTKFVFNLTARLKAKQKQFSQTMIVKKYKAENIYFCSIALWYDDMTNLDLLKFLKPK